MAWFPRALGVTTAAYRAAITARPALLLEPSGLLRDDRPEPEQEMFVRTLGVRDLVSGLAMAFATR
jgi:hypothetical protein